MIIATQFHFMTQIQGFMNMRLGLSLKNVVMQAEMTGFKALFGKPGSTRKLYTSIQTGLCSFVQLSEYYDVATKS